MPEVACSRLLVVRNDRLGDFMLAWPTLALLRASLPETRIAVLVPGYTAPLAAVCPWVDEVIVDPGARGTAAEQRELLAQLRRGRFDALLTLFSTWRVGWAGVRAGIPLRVAPATKAAQFLYPVRVRQRRSRSEKPEYVYNLDLATALLNRLGKGAREVEPPFWPLSQEERAGERRRLVDRLGLEGHGPLFLVHAGSGGSANNLGLDQYARIVLHLDGLLSVGSPDAERPHWILTAGPGERPRTEELGAMLRQGGLAPAIYSSSEGLVPFARSLAGADLFIAGSTGPLHVAGCLDVPTVGFFPAKRSSTPLRWRPCNGPGRTLGIRPPEGAADTDMGRIDPVSAAEGIAAFWARVRG
jgi:ADP-heptose:LPS heptosyltransferase